MKKNICGLVKNHIYMKFKCLKFILMIIKDRFQIQERYVHINFPSRMFAFNEAIDNYIVDVQCHFIVFFFFYQKREDFGEIKLICRGIDKKKIV